jgi:hypothetical protein
VVVGVAVVVVGVAVVVVGVAVVVVGVAVVVVGVAAFSPDDADSPGEEQELRIATKIAIWITFGWRGLLIFTSLKKVLMSRA